MTSLEVSRGVYISYFPILLFLKCCESEWKAFYACFFAATFSSMLMYRATWAWNSSMLNGVSAYNVFENELGRSPTLMECIGTFGCRFGMVNDALLNRAIYYLKDSISHWPLMIILRQMYRGRSKNLSLRKDIELTRNNWIIKYKVHYIENKIIKFVGSLLCMIAIIVNKKSKELLIQLRKLGLGSILLSLLYFESMIIFYTLIMLIPI